MIAHDHREKGWSADADEAGMGLEVGGCVRVGPWGNLRNRCSSRDQGIRGL
ncbi:MAG: hypothetical protein ACK462_04610 [Planctomyces sp.]